MKPIATIIITTLFFTSMAGQEICQSPSALWEFAPNGILTKLGHGGTLLWRSYGFNPPTFPQVNALYDATLWIGGRTPGGNIHLNAETYGFVLGNHSYSAGPIIPGGVIDPLLCSAFNTHWWITRQKIEAFKADFADDGILQDDHLAILRWPGRGNPNFISIYGVELPPQNFAPFHDTDGDGLYDPERGDYPVIKGDEAVWWMINSLGQPNTPAPGLLPVQFEIGIMAYAFQSADQVLNQTIFCELTMTNKASVQLSDTYIGLFIDPDIGCPYDDYVGCLPQQRLAFAYNADATDGEPGCICDFGVFTYCNDIPVFSAQLLDDFDNDPGTPVELNAFTIFDEESSPIDNPPNSNDPNIVAEYYNYLQGLWQDGTPFTVGGDGQTGSGDTTTFLFPDLPSDTLGWSMCTAEQPLDDRRMLMSIGPREMASGSTRRLTFAFHLMGIEGYPCPDLTPITEAAQQIQDYYDGVISSNFQVPVTSSFVSISPNPATGVAQIILSDANDKIATVDVFDTRGQQLRHFEKPGEQPFEITRNGLPAGVYFIRVKTQSNRIGMLKLVYQ